MNDIDLTDAQIEALLHGQPVPDVPEALGDFVSAIRAESTATPPVRATKPLADFFARVESNTTMPATLHGGSSRRKRMLAVVSGFVATTTGKLVLGTALAAATVGTAHAAGVADVPLLPDGADEPSVVEFEAGELDGDGTSGEDGVEDTDQTEVDETVDDADTSVDGPDNHGKEVSDFVHETELEGCEKGQAVSDLASSKADDRRQNPERNHDPCNKVDDVGADEVDEPEDVESNDTSGDDVERPEKGRGQEGSGAPGRSGDAPGQSGKPDKPGKP